MIEDFSAYHQPVSDFLSLPKSRAEWDRYRLSEEQVAFYREKGYVSGIPILSERQVDLLREQLQDLYDPNYLGNSLFHEYHTNESTDPARILFHALGAWRIKPGFHDVLWHPGFTVPASQLLGGAVRFWHDQLFCKPANHGGVVAWHQDYSYWTRTQPMNHLTCWIALDDSTRANGCLHYVPGSHRWPLLPITGLAGDMEAIREVLTEEQFAQFQSPAAIEMKKGQASFHHPLMVHGSFANDTDRPRRATVINAFLDGTRSASDEPLMAGIPVTPSGQKVDGQFFPLLFDPNATKKGSDAMKSGRS
jgi:hypothetical protein